MDNFKMISSVVKNGLCTGCGTCIALCPNNAIDIMIDETKGVYIPKFYSDKCNDCGICFKICPGHEVQYKKLNLEIFGKEPDDILMGNFLNCYTGHAEDPDIRYNSSSGGVITSLLIFALEEGLIDSALVTRMKTNNPLEAEPFIARTKEEIIEASKSKYCPVPVNSVLREILNSKDGYKYAVVGLPCHINGIRKAEKINLKLKKKIVLHLGLFCNHTPNLWATKLFLKKLNIKEDEVIKFDYRGEGWPGYMRINCKTRELKVHLPDYWRFIGKSFFYPKRCLMCCDGICELADISFGDAWLPEFSRDKIGTSIIVSKSKIGDKILNEIKYRNKMKFKEIAMEKVIQSQIGMLFFKKKNSAAYIKLSKKFTIYDNNLESNVIDNFFALFPYLNSMASSKSLLRKVLLHVPTKLILLYDLPYMLTYSHYIKMTSRKFYNNINY